jgi:transposase
MTLKIAFTDDEVADLFYWKERHPHPRVRKKMSVLYLKSQQLAHKEIKRLERITEATLLAYLNAYQQPNGLEVLKEIRFNKPKSDLMGHKDKLEAYFREYPPATSKAAAAKVEELTGIRRSPDRVRIFMKRIGMDIRKVGMIPAKADVEAQEKFLENELKPRLQEAKEGKRALFLSMPPTLF